MTIDIFIDVTDDTINERMGLFCGKMGDRVAIVCILTLFGVSNFGALLLFSFALVVTNLNTQLEIFFCTEQSNTGLTGAAHGDMIKPTFEDKLLEASKSQVRLFCLVVSVEL